MTNLGQPRLQMIEGAGLRSRSPGGVFYYLESTDVLLLGADIALTESRPLPPFQPPSLRHVIILILPMMARDYDIDKATEYLHSSGIHSVIGSWITLLLTGNTTPYPYLVCM